MPRAFNDDEIRRMRAMLIKAGRASFMKRGLKRTTIELLVNSVGIGKGSFYQFFKSKEELFLELFSEEIPAMMTRLHEVSFGATNDTREALVRLMKEMIYELDTNPLVQTFLNDPRELELFLSTDEFATLQKRIAAANSPIIECIEQARTRGEIINKDSRLIAQIIGMVKNLAVSKDSIPRELYRTLCDCYPEIIADGLTLPARRA
jgi:AcrR family transcriptional regulator